MKEEDRYREKRDCQNGLLKKNKQRWVSFRPDVESTDVRVFSLHCCRKERILPRCLQSWNYQFSQTLWNLVRVCVRHKTVGARMYRVLNFEPVLTKKLLLGRLGGPVG